MSRPDLIHLRDFIDGFLSSVPWQGLDRGGRSFSIQSSWGLLVVVPWKWIQEEAWLVSVTGTEDNPRMGYNVEL